MSRIGRLRLEYKKHIGLPWKKNLAGPQRVLFAVYDKEDELKLRAVLEEWKLDTIDAGHRFVLVELSGEFSEWMMAQENREAYFEDPEELLNWLPNFKKQLAERCAKKIRAENADDDTVVCLAGVATLFGFVKVAELVELLADEVPGRLLLLFPGTHEGNNYQFLDARDGWDYLATPIKLDTE